MLVCVTESLDSGVSGREYSVRASLGRYNVPTTEGRSMTNPTKIYTYRRRVLELCFEITSIVNAVLNVPFCINSFA